MKAIKSILSILAIVCVAATPLYAQQELDSESSREIAELIENANQPWQRVELNGKLKSDLLPLSPSLRIYMEKGLKLDISIRAPFLGEVGRIQATNDTIVAVNKMKRTYWCDSMSLLHARYPGGLEMLQSVILGRTVVFGQKPDDPDLAGMLNIYPDGEEGWLLMPKMDFQADGARYGYVVGAEGETLALIVEKDDSEDYLEVDYDWKKNGKYDMYLDVSASGKNIDGKIQFDSPKENPMPMAPLAIDSRYRKVDFHEFITKFI